MNATSNNLRLPWISLALLLLLVALAPLAMSLPPYPAYSSTDALQPRRVVLVLLGLMTAVAALIELVAVARRSPRDIITSATFAAAFLACAVVGWRSYPYWATGVYQVGIGAFPPMDQDPKRLIPMIWIGDLWRLPVLLLYLLCYVAVPALLVAAIIAFWRRRFVSGITTVLCVGIVLVFMLGFSPDYVTWLMDQTRPTKRGSQRRVHVSIAAGRRWPGVAALVVSFIFMNLIQSYFDWHDAKYLARAGDPRKNQRDIRLFRRMRVALFIITAILLMLLPAAIALTAFRGDSLAEASVLILGVMFPLAALFYTWVTEALLFRRYVSEHTAKS